MTASSSGDSWTFVHAAPMLGDAVVSVVGYRSALDAPAVHHGLPSPALTFVLTLDEPVVSGFSMQQATGSGAYRSTTVLGGLHDSPAYLIQPRVQTGVQLAVRPLAARRLLGVPAGELRNVADGADVLGPEIDRIRERMSELPSWQQRFDLLAEYLRRRMADAPARAVPRPDVVEAWKWMARHRGRGSMSGLARHVRLSERQVTAVIRAELGVGPKAVSRLLRFEHARQHLAQVVRSGAVTDLAAVASDCGFYDQSHLAREFRQYTGDSPSRWLAQQRGIIQAGASQPNENFEP